MGTISISTPSDGQTIDAADVNSPLNTIVAAINGNLDDDNIKTGANINGTKLLANSIPPTAYDANGRAGWNVGILPAPNTITANGNRNYSVVFNSTDLTSYISNGMRLRLTRTVAAPTQSTSLNGSTQYYSKSSPAGYTFTDSFTYSAWVRPSSYALGTIIGRFSTTGSMLQMNASGQLLISAKDAGTTDSAVTTQAIPLNKWTHVAMTMVVATNTVTAYIDGIAATTTYTNGTTTAVTQAGSLEVGGNNGGTNPFPGKIAQAAVYSAVISQATIQAAQTQTLTGSETSLISAYSFNGIITDLNTTNANNLTANGSAVATNVDSPFAGGANASTAYTAGTTEFGEVFSVSFSTNTTVVVQVPDGYAIPTSGGVSAVAYSAQSNPLGWPGTITTLGTAYLQSNFTTTTVGSAVDTGLATTVYVPAGRKVKITAFAQGMKSSQGAGNGVHFAIYEGSTELAECTHTTPVSSYFEAAMAQVVINPTTGSHTYKNTASQDAAGTITVNGSTNAPAFLQVELV